MKFRLILAAIRWSLAMIKTTRLSGLPPSTRSSLIKIGSTNTRSGDDFNKDFFSATVVRFSGMIVKNYVAKISNTKPWSYELKRPEKGSCSEV